MISNSDLLGIKELLLSSREEIVILSHPSPDGDSVGSTLGLYFLLKQAGVVSLPTLPGPIPDRYSFLARGMQIASTPVDVVGKTVVVLDCGDLKRLEQTGQKLDGASKVINIDHHLGNDMFGDYNYVDPSAAAVGQILYDMFAEFPCPTPAAQALFTAIYTDTGRFSYGNTNSHTLTVAAKLVELGAEPDLVFDHLFQTRTKNYYGFLVEALANIQVSCNGQYASLCLDLSAIQRHNLADWELEELNDYPRSLAGVKVSCILKEAEAGVVKVSLRSKGAVDVAFIARSVGGGGHKNAAGATLYMSLTQAAQLVEAKVSQELLP